MQFQWRIQEAPPERAPPYRFRFFRFDIQIFRNVATSGVGAPLRGRRPLPEILDPLLNSSTMFDRYGLVKVNLGFGHLKLTNSVSGAEMVCFDQKLGLPIF